MDDCNYKCINNDLYEEENINNETYNIDYYDLNINKIYSLIEDLFKEKYFYNKIDLLLYLSKDSKYNNNAINIALHKMTNNSNIIIKDKYNKKGYLINIDDLYIFQPLVLNNKNSSLFTKNHPIKNNNSYISYKVPEKIEDTLLNKKINLDKSKVKIVKEFEEEYDDDDVMLTARTNNNIIFNYIVSELQNIINPTSKYIESFKSNKEKIKLLCELIFNFKKKNINILNLNNTKIDSFNIPKKEVIYLIVNILLDTLNFDSTKKLIEYIYNLSDEFIFKDSIEITVIEIIKSYYDEKMIESDDKKLKGFIFDYNIIPEIYKKNIFDKYNYILFIFDSNNLLKIANPMDYNDLNSIIENKYNINNTNSDIIIGFIKVLNQTSSNEFRNEYQFKIKTFNTTKETFNNGKNSISFDSPQLIEYYESIIKEKPPKLSANLYCMLLELILRYFKYINKDDKFWFADINEIIINNKNYK